MGKSPPNKAWRRTYLRQWREWGGLKLGELAALTGMNEGYLSEIENGHKRYNQKILEAYAKELKVPAGRLIDRMPPPKGTATDPSDPAVLVATLEGMSEADRRRVVAIIKSLADIQGQ